jgi:Ribbon-helix-helix domain
MPVGVLLFSVIQILHSVNFLPVMARAKGDLSRFVEESVRAHILDLAAIAAKTENAAYSQADIEGAIDEALTWARQ